MKKTKTTTKKEPKADIWEPKATTLHERPPRKKAAPPKDPEAAVNELRFTLRLEQELLAYEEGKVEALKKGLLYATEVKEARAASVRRLQHEIARLTNGR